jgi:hypothetical protein
VHRESRPPDPVAEVIHRMQKIRDSLKPHDGVACFNRMYLQVTELIGQNLVEDFFADDSFVDRLDVILPDCTSRVWMQSRLVKAQPVLETTIRCPLQPCRMAHPVRVSRRERSHQPRPYSCDHRDLSRVRKNAGHRSRPCRLSTGQGAPRQGRIRSTAVVRDKIAARRDEGRRDTQAHRGELEHHSSPRPSLEQYRIAVGAAQHSFSL